MRKFRVRSYFASSEKDNYEKGCYGKTLTYHGLRYEIYEADTLTALIEKLKNVFGVDGVDLDSCDETGRLDLSGLKIRPFEQSRPSKNSIAEWVKGEINLYYTVYTFTVEIIESKISLCDIMKAENAKIV
jgi:hypothetical protein